jgi:hypothetical protein
MVRNHDGAAVHTLIGVARHGSTVSTLHGAPAMRLFHFSDDSEIAVFEPRPVRVPIQRPKGFEWLNGPLVWAIDEAREPMYLFPRECPRVLVWATPETTSEDHSQWFGERSCRVIAHIEWAWLHRLTTEIIHRYEMPASHFEDLGDAGMWVSRIRVEPLGIVVLEDLPAELQSRGVELRIMETLAPLKAVWNTSLHVSGIRLQNARAW